LRYTLKEEMREIGVYYAVYFRVYWTYVGRNFFAVMADGVPYNKTN
jgi:hypothetical protein